MSKVKASFSESENPATVPVSPNSSLNISNKSNENVSSKAFRIKDSCDASPNANEFLISASACALAEENDMPDLTKFRMRLAATWVKALIANVPESRTSTIDSSQTDPEIAFSRTMGLFNEIPSNCTVPPSLTLYPSQGSHSSRNVSITKPHGDVVICDE